MQTSKTWKLISYEKNDLLWTTGLIVLSIIAPAILAHTPQNQWLTGTLVNTVLFVSAWRLGIVNAIFIAALPSSIALMRGLLLPPQVILIPFIITSNILLVSIFVAIKKQPLVGMLTASFLKFIFLSGIVSLLFSDKLPPILIEMMRWPQLITALAGGTIALILIKQLSKE